MSIRQRFVAEAERLGSKNQSTIAMSCGVSQAAISKIKLGESVPAAETLAAFALRGADVHFILTGQRQKQDIDWQVITALVEFRVASKEDAITVTDAVEIVRSAIALWQEIQSRNASTAPSSESEANPGQEEDTP